MTVKLLFVLMLQYSYSVITTAVMCEKLLFSAPVLHEVYAQLCIVYIRLSSVS